MCRADTSSGAADLSEVCEASADGDPHHRPAHGTHRAPDGCIGKVQGLDLLVEEGSVLRRCVGRAAALEIVRHFPPGGNLVRADGSLDLGFRPGLDVVGLLLGELRLILADRDGSGTGGYALYASRRRRRRQSNDEKSAEGERARHFGALEVVVRSLG